MGAVFNLWDLAARTPDRIIRVFFELYDQETVRMRLLQIFAGFTANDEKGGLALLIEEKEVALLFDQLIDLVGAIHTLRNAETSKCPVCDRAGSVPPGEA